MPAPEAFFDEAEFAPSLRSAIGDKPFDLRHLWRLAMKVNETEDSYVDAMVDRRDVFFTVGEESVEWRVESLASLFRGNEPAPKLEKYPAAYIPLFATIEDQVLVYADIFEEPTDEEMMGVYSNLARLPDARGANAAA